MDNHGARRLRELGLTATKIMQEIDAPDHGMVSRWCRGVRKPDTTWRAKLEETYGVGWKLWDEDIAASEEPPTEPEKVA